AAGGVTCFFWHSRSIDEGDLCDPGPIEKTLLIVAWLRSDAEKADADLRGNDGAPNRALKCDLLTFFQRFNGGSRPAAPRRLFDDLPQTLQIRNRVAGGVEVVGEHLAFLGPALERETHERGGRPFRFRNASLHLLNSIPGICGHLAIS